MSVSRSDSLENFHEASNKHYAVEGLWIVSAYKDAAKEDKDFLKGVTSCHFEENKN